VSPLYRLDLEWFQAIHVGLHRPWLDPIFLVLSYLGLGQVQAVIAIGLLFSPKTKMYTLPLLWTLIVCSLAAQIPKHLIERDRPSRLVFAHPQEAWLANSFPSGHTTSAFGFAFVLLFVTVGTRRAWIGWTSRAIAALVGLSRIYRGVHWPSDVIAGMFFGAASATLVFLVLDRMGKILHLDEPEATLTGREASEQG
jgi:undecaprenyl-diphosphatase